jgi:hypothetical protein
MQIDPFIPDGVEGHNSWLESLAGPRGSAGLVLAGLLVSVTGLLTGTSITRIAIFGPVAFSVMLWLAWGEKKKKVISGIAILLVLSLVLAVRVYSVPDTVKFFYNGAPLRTSVIPYVRSDIDIPLTDDPTKGIQSDSISFNDGADIEVSCTRDGLITDGAHSAKLEWAAIVGGKYETLWVPMAFVRSQAEGQARTLLPCSNWRWELQYLGRQ